MSSAQKISSGLLALIAIVLGLVALRGSWVHGDESTIAALLVSATLLCLASLALAVVSLRTSGIRSWISWALVASSVIAGAIVFRGWDLL
jgi:hypothetical protein